jgi:hypothetical protein
VKAVILGYVTARMSANVDTIVGLAKGVGEEQARWKPARDKWSILEVIGHLWDEEQYDFRARIEFTLNQPGEEWPPFDPLQWMEERRHNEGILEETLQTWIDERRRSIEWLHSLSSPDWNRSYNHPGLGRLRAGDLLAAWLVHDLLHIRQLATLHVDYTARVSAPFHSRYAAP